jgi:hypothetical protein
LKKIVVAHGAPSNQRVVGITPQRASLPRIQALGVIRGGVEHSNVRPAFRALRSAA